MTVQINIMAVPERLYQAAIIQKQIGGRLFVDTNHRGCWWNAKRCWEYSGGAEHILVIQDDVILTKNFTAFLSATIAVKPKEIISYFMGPIIRVPIRKKYSKSHWIRISGVCTAQAIVMPTFMAIDFIRWTTRNLIYDDKQIDDQFLRMFQIATHNPHWQTIPDIVNHLGNTNSYIWKEELKWNTSWNFDENLAANFDWTVGTDRTEIVESWRAPEIHKWYESHKRGINIGNPRK